MKGLTTVINSRRLYWLIWQMLWVLSVNPFRLDRSSSWVLAILTLSATPWLVRNSPRRLSSLALLVFATSVVALSALGGAVLFGSSGWTQHDNALWGVVAGVTALVALLMIWITPWDFLWSTAFVYAFVAPLLLLVAQPDLSSAGFGANLGQFEDPEVAILFSAGMGAASVLWLRRLIGSRTLAVVSVSYLCGLWFLSPLANATVAGLAALLVSLTIAVAGRLTSLPRWTAVSIALLPVLLFALAMSVQVRALVGAVLSKSDSWSGRSTRWDAALLEWSTAPFSIRVPYTALRQDPHSIYISALHGLGLVGIVSLLAGLCVLLYVVARRNTHGLPLAVWVCVYGVAGSSSVDVASYAGFVSWSFIAVNLTLVTQRPRLVCG